jgi:hypothetical protein
VASQFGSDRMAANGRGVTWPCRSEPQQVSVPSVLIAQVWNRPALTAVKVPDGGVAWPWSSKSGAWPQQVSVPSVLIAQAWYRPALTAVKVPVGGVARPFPLEPQQASVPSVLIAQV